MISKTQLRRILAIIALCTVGGGLLNAQERVSKAKAKCPQFPVLRPVCEFTMTPIAWTGGFGDGAMTGAKLGLILAISFASYAWAHRRLKLTEILVVSTISGAAIALLYFELGGTMPDAIAFHIYPFPQENSDPSNIGDAFDLFTSMDALGVRAIGHAEGNLTVEGDRTSLYYGHSDPGNFKQNQGWCSDQGRGGGDVHRADVACMQRITNQLGRLYAGLNAAGIDPHTNLAVAINIVDLYNQAAPWVSANFPLAYQSAISADYAGSEAIAWARTAAFIRDPNEVTPHLDTATARLDAAGLLGICRRENRGVSDWDCVHHDQARRVRAISAVQSYETTRTATVQR